MSGVYRKVAAGLAIGALAAALVFILAAAGYLDIAELKLYDWRMRQTADPASVDHDIALVEINDTTIRDLQPLFGHWPWPRIALSYVIDFLHRAPAKVVAVDLIFAESDTVAAYDIGGERWSGAQSDKALADSVRQSGNVIMLADAVDEGTTTGAADTRAAHWTAPKFAVDGLAEHRPVILPPYQALTDASAALAHNFLALDRDGPARRMAPFVENDGRYLPSLGVAAALRAAGIVPSEVTADGSAIRMGDRRMPLVPVPVRDVYRPGVSHSQWTMLIDYRAPAVLENAHRPYPSYEFRNLFESEQQLLAGVKPRVDPAVFKDKIVFIGLTASGLTDVFQTPMSSQATGTMPGIQLHASVADGILSNRFVHPVSRKARIAGVLLTAAAVGLLAAFLPFSTAAGASAGAFVGWTWAAIAVFRHGLWLNLAQPLAAGAIALFAGTAYQYFVEGREKRKISRLFGRFVSRSIYAHLMSNADHVALGGKRREMTVLFSDIRGFTAVTESGDPEDLVEQLNEYFTRMVDIVFRHSGTLDKFVGDMVMALFGAPLDDASHAEHAVQAAIDMVRELGELNRKWAVEGRPTLDIGIGINSGDMIAGNIGSSEVMSYTVIGDNVNLGSRLESLNKEYKTRIIISDATRARLTRAYPMRPLGDVTVKGKTRPVAIFEVKAPGPLVTAEEAPV